ncbi:hypothetical protein GW17_00013340 [Ensete ventricosum]|uniref:Uncharacterized protein n=1 Tax=Ensete ventricosum TaxID=4639 RepID=A0A444FIJ9_ENSVE|nr:hypothetical protein GW17_00013340 [Ensete ventricosum]RZR74626.1 hypothetical protein BHM03_00039610 [Ensete ventricosum]
MSSQESVLSECDDDDAPVVDTELRLGWLQYADDATVYVPPVDTELRLRQALVCLTCNKIFTSSPELGVHQIAHDMDDIEEGFARYRERETGPVVDEEEEDDDVDLDLSLRVGGVDVILKL